MLLWLKGLAIGFGAGVVTMGIVSFFSDGASGGDQAPAPPIAAVHAARARTGELAEQAGTPTSVRVQAAALEESARIPAPTFLDSPPSREALPEQSTRTRRAGELEAINAVRAALIAKDPKSALAQLNRYELDFPEASFGLPAQLLRIEALAVSGRPQAAKELASGFVAAHPDSVHAERLRVFASQ